jgi:hypothetical protein
MRPFQATERQRLPGSVLSSLALVIALLFSCSGPSFGAEVGPIVISVPPTFEAPSKETANGGVTVVWIERQPVTGAGTLLQVSAIDGGPSLEGISKEQRLDGATHYVLEFLRGVGEPLLKFQYGDPEYVPLAGQPGARVRWTATTTGGQAAIGVIYCVLVGHTIVSLQTRDTGTEFTPSMYAAIAAIEAIRAR